jgi:tetratricopeptide (TPR) repeat protein
VNYPILERIIDKTLAKNPNDRYQTVDQMEADLKDLQHVAQLAILNVRKNSWIPLLPIAALVGLVLVITLVNRAMRSHSTVSSESSKTRQEVLPEIQSVMAEANTVNAFYTSCGSGKERDIAAAKLYKLHLQLAQLLTKKYRAMNSYDSEMARAEIAKQYLCAGAVASGIAEAEDAFKLADQVAPADPTQAQKIREARKTWWYREYSPRRPMLGPSLEALLNSYDMVIFGRSRAWLCKEARLESVLNDLKKQWYLSRQGTLIFALRLLDAAIVSQDRTAIDSICHATESYWESADAPECTADTIVRLANFKRIICGNDNDAISLCDRAIARINQAFPGHGNDFCRAVWPALSSKAAALESQKKYDAAIDCLRMIERNLYRIPPGQQRLITSAIANEQLGSIYSAQSGHYRLASDYFSKSMRLYEQAGKAADAARLKVAKDSTASMVVTSHENSATEEVEHGKDTVDRR